MEYKIEYLKEAEKELTKLPKKQVRQVLSKIDTLAYFETATGIKQLKGNFGTTFYRLRSGDYRIIFTVEAGRVVVVIVRIAHRKDAYKNF